MKTFFKICLILIVLILGVQNFVMAADSSSTSPKIAVFPVDTPTNGSYYSIYPGSLQLITNDFINYINTNSDIIAVDLNTAENIIANNGLYKKYKHFLGEYKTSYKIDYNFCLKLANTLNVDKIILISGGFDLQKSLLKRNFWYRINFPDAEPLIPSYRYVATFSLIDPQEGTIQWENTYNKDFMVNNFALAGQGFGENVMPIEKLKEFSKEISVKAVNSINEKTLFEVTTKIERVDGTSTSSQLELKPPMEGTKTTDGQLLPNTTTPPEAHPYKKNTKKVTNWLNRQLMND